MRLATFAEGKRARVGAIEGERIVPVADDMLELISAGQPALERAKASARDGSGSLGLDTVKLLAPIPAPRRNVFCVGWNYSEHFAEGTRARGEGAPRDVPEHPAFFSKNPATIVGPEANVLHPGPASVELDWEVELALVIGTAGRDIAEEGALHHVFGYTCVNDVSVRDFQQRRHGTQWFKGKNFDTHCPLGPWIVTADEIQDPQRLALCSRVNGVTKQDSNTRHMVFTVARIIAELSIGMTLLPGDVIATGTPEGVGFARTPPEFMNVGDVVEVEVEGIGVLRNTIVRA